MQTPVQVSRESRGHLLCLLWFNMPWMPVVVGQRSWQMLRKKTGIFVFHQGKYERTPGAIKGAAPRRGVPMGNWWATLFPAPAPAPYKHEIAVPIDRAYNRESLTPEELAGLDERQTAKRESEGKQISPRNTKKPIQVPGRWT